nr:DUF948 domain-containing protein [uncultured Holophaga sp.]
MLVTLEIILALAVIVLVGFLVPLLLQLRRTAQAMEDLARTARNDLDHMTQDVHCIRLQTEEMAKVVGETLELPRTLSRTLTGLVQSIPAMFGRREGGSGRLELLLAGFQAAASLFRRRRSAGEKERSHE